MRIIHLAGVGLLAGLIGCATGPSLPEGGEPRVAPPPFDLPLPDETGRQASFAVVLTAMGHESFDQSAGAVPMLPQMQLPAGPGGLEWAIYQLNTSGHPVIGLEVTFEVLSGEGCWIGLPDYNGGSWNVGGPFTGTVASFGPPDPDWISPLNNLYVAVIAHDDSTVVVNQVSASVDIPLWQDHIVDPDAGRGQFSSLAVHEGMPIIAYHNAANGGLRFARALIAAPAQETDWARMIIDEPG